MLSLATRLDEERFSILDFHTKDYSLQFLFDQHENAKRVKLNGFQNGFRVRVRLRNMAAKKLNFSF